MNEYDKSTKPTILSEKEIADRMADLPGWLYKDNKLSKKYAFGTFIDAIQFVNDIAKFFEKVDHHADMFISHKKITFELQRYDIGGKVTDRDFLVAKEIESRYRNL